MLTTLRLISLMYMVIVLSNPKFGYGPYGCRVGARKTRQTLHEALDIFMEKKNFGRPGSSLLNARKAASYLPHVVIMLSNPKFV